MKYDDKKCENVGKKSIFFKSHENYTNLSKLYTLPHQKSLVISNFLKIRILRKKIKKSFSESSKKCNFKNKSCQKSSMATNGIFFYCLQSLHADNRYLP